MIGRPTGQSLARSLANADGEAIRWKRARAAAALANRERAPATDGSHCDLWQGQCQERMRSGAPGVEQTLDPHAMATTGQSMLAISAKLSLISCSFVRSRRIVRGWPCCELICRWLVLGSCMQCIVLNCQSITDRHRPVQALRTYRAQHSAHCELYCSLQ